MLTRLARRSPRELALLAEAFGCLGAARLAARFLPFSWVMDPARAPVRRRRAPTPQAQDNAVRDVRWAIFAVARAAPFRAACLQQSLAARAMLARRGVETLLNLGAAMGEARQLEAHAWLSRDETVIVGAGPVERFARLATFAPERAEGAA